MSDTEKTVHCPKCKGTDIREKNEAYTELEVTGWDIDSETGHPTPTDYESDSEPEWSAVDGPNIYVCRVCRWEGDTDALEVRSA